MNPAPPIISARPRRSAPLGWFAGALAGMTLLGAGAVLFFFNPSTHGFYPACQFHALTGLNCPGCGATRALYALLHGNFLQAAKDNALLLAALLGATIWGVARLIGKLRGRPAAFSVPTKLWWLALAGALVFAVIRNVPGFEWLSP